MKRIKPVELNKELLQGVIDRLLPRYSRSKQFEKSLNKLLMKYPTTDKDIREIYPERNTNRYRHSKGGLYHKLFESQILHKPNPELYEIVGYATYESTLDRMEIYRVKEEHVTDNFLQETIVCFAKRKPEPEEFLQQIVVYMSAVNEKIWVRSKIDFEEILLDKTPRFKSDIL